MKAEDIFRKKEESSLFLNSPDLQRQFVPSEEELPGRPESQRRWIGLQRYLRSRGITE